jgi:hypothetical protein
LAVAELNQLGTEGLENCCSLSVAEATFTVTHRFMLPGLRLVPEVNSSFVAKGKIRAKEPLGRLLRAALNRNCRLTAGSVTEIRRGRND